MRHTKNWIYSFILFLFLVACKKEPITASEDLCSQTTLKSNIIYDGEVNNDNLITLYEAADGSFYGAVKVNYIDHKLVKIDASSIVTDSYLLDSERIYDLVILPDGRCMFASPHETGDISVLSADFSSVQRITMELVTPPKFTIVEENVLLTVGSLIYDTQLIMLNNDFEPIWTKNIDRSKPSTQYYCKENKRLYLVVEGDKIVEINALSGEVLNTFDHGQSIFKLFYEDGFIYATGTIGPIGNCERDIFASKMDVTTGEILWLQRFGSEEADDWGADITVFDNYIYVGGSLSKDCYAGNTNFYIHVLNMNGEKFGCYSEQNYPFSSLSKFLISKTGELNAVGKFSFSEVSNFKTIFRPI